MLITVVVPVYNTEKYLTECLNSIINQSYKDMQIILVDDGSKDGSGKICDSFSKKDKRICVIHKTNEGQFAARQTALKTATGDYCIFVDSDDVLRQDAVEIIAQKIKEFGCDILIYEASRNSDFTTPLMNIPLKPDFLYAEDSLKDVYGVVVGTGKINSMCIQAINRKLFDINDDYSEFYKMRNAEDSIMSMMLIDKAQSIVYTDDVLYYYRENHASVTYRYQKNYYESLKKAELKRREYSQKWFGKILQSVYDKNIDTCFHCMTYETTANNCFTYTKKQLRRIAYDDFAKTSYEFSDKSNYSSKHLRILRIIMKHKLLHDLIIMAYKIKMFLKH